MKAQIHNVRFYNLKPRAIVCFGFNKSACKLALSRDDGSIEVWDMKNIPYFEKLIVNGQGNMICSLAWAFDRLFSAGNSDEVTEWNLLTLKTHKVVRITGSNAKCMDVHEQRSHLAIGTKEGYITLIDISDNQMQHKRLFDRQCGEIVCCKFDSSGDVLVTGSVGSMRIWDVNSGHAMHRLSLDVTNKGKSVVIHSLLIMRDFTIITGDSSGVITIWDGNTAAFVESHNVLQAHVLALAINDDESLLICSGVEPIIRILALVGVQRDDQTRRRWVRYYQHNVHDHDVRALACFGDRVYSGGIDGYIGVSTTTRSRGQTIQRYGPFLQNPCCMVAASKRLILLRYNKSLEIWQLQNVLENEKRIGRIGEPKKLITVQSRYKALIISAALSADGNWICYSTEGNVRLFKLTLLSDGDAIQAQLTPIEAMTFSNWTALHIRFSGNASEHLHLVNGDSIVKFQMPLDGNNEIDVLESVNVRSYIKDVITLFDVSHDGNYVMAAGACRNIAVWKADDDGRLQHYVNLPRYSAVTTAIAMHPLLPRVVAAFSDGKIFEYDLDELCFKTSHKNRHGCAEPTHCTTNIIMDAMWPDIFVTHDDQSLFVMRRTSSSDSNYIKAKMARDTENIDALEITMQKRCEHLLCVARLTSHEMVAVIVEPTSLIQKLPNAFKQKRFGLE